MNDELKKRIEERNKWAKICRTPCRIYDERNDLCVPETKYDTELIDDLIAEVERLEAENQQMKEEVSRYTIALESASFLEMLRLKKALGVTRKAIDDTMERIYHEIDDDDIDIFLRYPLIDIVNEIKAILNEREG